MEFPRDFLQLVYHKETFNQINLPSLDDNSHDKAEEEPAQEEEIRQNSGEK